MFSSMEPEPGPQARMKSDMIFALFEMEGGTFRGGDGNGAGSLSVGAFVGVDDERHHTGGGDQGNSNEDESELQQSRTHISHTACNNER